MSCMILRHVEYTPPPKKRLSVVSQVAIRRYVEISTGSWVFQNNYNELNHENARFNYATELKVRPRITSTLNLHNDASALVP